MPHPSFMIGPRRVGDGQPCLVIGEVGLLHEGSLGLAHCFVDAIADAGADAVKFQTHLPEFESTPLERFRVPFSTQDATRPDYWRRTAFAEPQWAELAEHARRRGLLFLSSPFSPEAADLLLRVGTPAWKVASGETGNTPLLRKLVGTGLPLLLSTGMSDLREIDAGVALAKEADVPVAVFQCTSAYPCPPERLGLNLLPTFKDRWECPVGLSDHSGTTHAGVAAATLGAKFLEVHVTLSRRMFGPDVSASVTVDELKQLVEGVRFVERATASPVDKDVAAAALAPLRDLFTKSISAEADLPAGTVLAAHHLSGRKPGTGIPVSATPRVIGRRLRNDVRRGALLNESDLA
ncbi:MAG TPA: N-acetylneuraminate synthase family protein [Humisphaera sp.]